MIKHLVPPPLKRGDCLAVFAPSGFLDEKDLFFKGIKILRELGYTTKPSSPSWSGADYLSGNDHERSSEFNRLWVDPEVKGLIALRGGYGCLRILDKIDLSIIRKQPKLVIGFSDITILNNYLTEHTGLVTLHGPVITTLSQLTPESTSRFHYSLLGKWNKELHCRNLEILHGGANVKGRLAGGNLSSLASLLGTPFEPDWSGKIIFLEDVGEPLYRLDRLFTQFSLAGKFDHIAGLILGDFSLSSHYDPLEKLRIHEAIWQRVSELTKELRIPVWGGFEVGHIPTNMTLPLGAEAVMNSNRAVLEFGA